MTATGCNVQPMTSLKCVQRLVEGDNVWRI